MCFSFFNINRRNLHSNIIEKDYNCKQSLIQLKLYWLRHYATSRIVAGSIPDEIILFFN
jgi:hypothetical protein